MTRTWIVAVLVASSVAAGGCSLGGDSDKAGGERRPDAVVLTLANHRDPNQDLDEFAREVARQSNGPVAIEFKNGWRREQRRLRAADDRGRARRQGRSRQGGRARFRLAGVKQPAAVRRSVCGRQLRARARGAAQPLAARMLRGVERLDLVGHRAAARRSAQAARHVPRRSLRPRTTAAQRSELACPSWAVAPSGRSAPPASSIVPGSDIVGVRRIRDRTHRVEDDRLRRSAAHARRQREPLAARLAIVMNRDAYGA